MSKSRTDYQLEFQCRLIRTAMKSPQVEAMNLLGIVMSNMKEFLVLRMPTEKDIEETLMKAAEVFDLLESAISAKFINLYLENTTAKAGDYYDKLFEPIEPPMAEDKDGPFQLFEKGSLPETTVKLFRDLAFKYYPFDGTAAAMEWMNANPQHGVINSDGIYRTRYVFDQFAKSIDLTCLDDKEDIRKLNIIHTHMAPYLQVTCPIPIARKRVKRDPSNAISAMVHGANNMTRRPSITDIALNRDVPLTYGERTTLLMKRRLEELSKTPARSVLIDFEVDEDATHVYCENITSGNTLSERYRFVFRNALTFNFDEAARMILETERPAALSYSNDVGSLHRIRDATYCYCVAGSKTKEEVALYRGPWVTNLNEEPTHQIPVLSDIVSTMMLPSDFSFASFKTIDDAIAAGKEWRSIFDAYSMGDKQHPDYPATTWPVGMCMTIYRTDPLHKPGQWLNFIFFMGSCLGSDAYFVIEPNARGDEKNNALVAQNLAKLGCNVFTEWDILGIPVEKIHAKAITISFETRMRDEKNELTLRQEILDVVSTGNFSTAASSQFSDTQIIMTSQNDHSSIWSFWDYLFRADQNLIKCLYRCNIAPSSVSNILSDESFEQDQLKSLLLRRIYEQVDANQQAFNEYMEEFTDESPDFTGYTWIAIKVNHLTEPDVINALWDAAKEGVNVFIIARTTCAIPAYMRCENMHIVSAMGKYLEHDRYFMFGHYDKESVVVDDAYVSSSDLMVRNFTKRLEMTFRVDEPVIKELMRNIFFTYITPPADAQRQGLFIYQM